jgi:hypothetical protein
VSGSDDDELVVVRRLPRWLRLAAWSMAGVLAGAVVAVVISRHHGRSTAPPVPSPVVGSSGGSSGVPNPPAASHAAVAEAGDLRWEVADTTLYAESAAGPHFVRQIALPQAFGTPVSEPRVTVDPVSGAVWVVLEKSRPSLLVRVSAGIFRILRVVHWMTAVNGAAAYAGHLYLSTGLGVADLAPRASRPRPLTGLAGAVGPVVADPSRHRLIAMDLGNPTDLWTFAPGTAPAKAPRPLPLNAATMAVVGPAIWVLGYVGDRAVLGRLDPETLRQTTRVQLPAHLSTRAVLLPGGDRALWLSGPLAGDRLVCADARTGAALQTWQIQGVDSVAPWRGSALVSAGGLSRTIHLRGCPA